MITTLLGIKKEMSARFDQRGFRIPVTRVTADPNVVLKIGNGRIKLGIGQKKRPQKPDSAYIKAVGFAPKLIKEIKLSQEAQAGAQQLKASDKITVSIFEPQDLVKVTGITKGKGFAGGVKRWGFAGGPKTHGQSDRHRAPGSIGQTTTPARVYRGKKMAGHMGVAKHTVRGLEIVEVDVNNNSIVIKGAIPGAKNSFIVIEKTGKAKVHAHKPQEKEDQSQVPPQPKNEESKKEEELGK